MLYKWWFCRHREAKTGFGTQLSYRRGVDNDEEVWAEVFTKRRVF